MYAYVPVHQLTLDFGESTSKLVNWSLPNWHVGETTAITYIFKRTYAHIHARMNVYLFAYDFPLLFSTIYFLCVALWKTKNFWIWKMPWANNRKFTDCKRYHVTNAQVANSHREFIQAKEIQCLWIRRERKMCLHLANCQASIHKYSSQKGHYLLSAMENKWVDL